MFDTQIKILKNHYRIQGQIELLTNLIAPLDSGLDSNMFRFVMPEAMRQTEKSPEADDTTTVQVDMASTETGSVKEVDQTKSDSDDSLPAL